MARTNASLLIDSEDLGQWQSISFRSHWRNETRQFGSLALMDSALVTTVTNSTSNITIEFDGSGLSVFGMSRKGWDLHGVLDGKTQNTSITSTPSWGRWYQTDTILPEFHKLELSNIPNDIYMDYVVAHPPFKYSIKNETLIVDNNDPAIRYSGVGWQQSTEEFFVQSDTRFDTYGGTTHISSTVGDVLQFPFTGSTISVYGFALVNVSGSASISFQVDKSTPIVKKLPPSVEDVGSSSTVVPNHLFLDRTLKAGNHILTINVTEVQGDQRFILDYILYESSFDSLDKMPVIQLPSLPNSSSDPTSSSSSDAASDTTTRTGKIVGGVVGGVAGLLIILAFILFLIQRRRKRLRTEKLIALPAPFVDVESPPARVPIEKQQGSPSTDPTSLVSSVYAGSSQEVGSSSDIGSPGRNPDRQRVVELERRVNELLAERQPPPSYSDIHLPRRTRSSSEIPTTTLLSIQNH